jgi:hypothetical protein
LLDQGLKISSELSTLVRSIPVAHRYRVSISKNDLIGIYKLSVLLKSIQDTMNKYDVFISNTMFKIECHTRVRWRRLFARFQTRQVSMKCSDRRMNSNSSLKLISLVARSEFLSNNQGRNIQSICLSMLLPFFNQQELLELNQLMDLMRVQSFERIRSFTDCSHLYWHIQTIDTYYTHAFGELNGPTSLAYCI